MDAEDHNSPLSAAKTSCPPSRAVVRRTTCKETVERDANSAHKELGCGERGDQCEGVAQSWIPESNGGVCDVWCPSSFFGRSIGAFALAHLMSSLVYVQNPFSLYSCSLVSRLLLVSSLLPSPHSSFTIRPTGKRADQRTDQQPERPSTCPTKSGVCSSLKRPLRSSIRPGGPRRLRTSRSPSRTGTRSYVRPCPMLTLGSPTVKRTWTKTWQSFGSVWTCSSTHE